MKSKLAKEAERKLVEATQRLGPEERLHAQLAHCRLVTQLYEGRQRDAISHAVTQVVRTSRCGESGAQLFPVTLGNVVRANMLEHSDLVLDIPVGVASTVPAFVSRENVEADARAHRSGLQVD